MLAIGCLAALKARFYIFLQSINNPFYCNYYQTAFLQAFNSPETRILPIPKL
jgi:hypothetical protein